MSARFFVFLALLSLFQASTTFGDVSEYDWQNGGIGTCKEGGASFQDGGLRIASNGAGFASGGDSLYYVWLPGEAVQTIRFRTGAGEAGQRLGGVMFRASADPGSPMVFAGVGESGQLLVLNRALPFGDLVMDEWIVQDKQIEFLIELAKDTVTVSVSLEDGEPILLDAYEVPATSKAMCGFTVASRGNSVVETLFEGIALGFRDPSEAPDEPLSDTANSALLSSNSGGLSADNKISETATQAGGDGSIAGAKPAGNSEEKSENRKLTRLPRRIFVDAKGDDRFSGLQSSVANGDGPKRNITTAVAESQDGDVIQVKGGSYRASVIQVKDKDVWLVPDGDVVIVP